MTEAGGRASPSLVYRLSKLAAVLTRDEAARYEGRLTWEAAMWVLAVKDAGERDAVLRAILAMMERPSSRRVPSAIWPECDGRRRVDGQV